MGLFNPGIDIQTSAGRLGLVPQGVVGVHAFDGDGPLFQSIARVTGKLNHSSYRPTVVAAGQVTVLNEGFVAVARCKGCTVKNEQRRGKN